ncbi:site-specific integrase [Vibrio breoganii]
MKKKTNKGYRAKKNRTPEEKQKQQAINVVSQLKNRGDVKSDGTARNYIRELKLFAKYLNKQGTALKHATKQDAIEYLTDRSVLVGNSSLNTFRQAADKMLVMTKVMPKDEKLPTDIKSEKIELLSSRAYLPEQIELVQSRQSEKNALSTAIGESCGLRAHEFYTLRRRDEVEPDKRPISDVKFSGLDIERDYQMYVVTGKGGLKREVALPNELATLLEARRLDKPLRVKDRDVVYKSYYDIGGGHNWSQSFSEASHKALGWSHGAHGLRHSFAQRRMSELKWAHDYNDALEAVSQEMGHFRLSITMVYLR